MWEDLRSTLERELHEEEARTENVLVCVPGRIAILLTQVENIIITPCKLLFYTGTDKTKDAS